MTRLSDFRARKVRTAAALLLGIGLAACGATPSATPSVVVSASASPTQAASAGVSNEATESLAPFTCALPVHAAATIDRAQISDLGVGSHDGYDRIVFGFVAGLPEITVETANPPFTQDASGLAIPVEGSSFLRITLHGGTVQTLGGGTSYSGQTTFTPRFSKLVQLKAAGDFEAVATWYVGMTSSACVRIFSLDAPTRLVIDLQQ